MIKKIAKYQAIVIRYTMDKADLEQFEVSHDSYTIVSETKDRITVDVVEFMQKIKE